MVFNLEHHLTSSQGISTVRATRLSCKLLCKIWQLQLVGRAALRFRGLQNTGKGHTGEFQIEMQDASPTGHRRKRRQKSTRFNLFKSAADLVSRYLLFFDTYHKAKNLLYSDHINNFHR